MHKEVYEDDKLIDRCGVCGLDIRNEVHIGVPAAQQAPEPRNSLSQGALTPYGERMKILKAFDEGLATVHLHDGPRPSGKSEDFIKGQTRGIEQGLKISRTILEAALAVPAAQQAEAGDALDKEIILLAEYGHQNMPLYHDAGNFLTCSHFNCKRAVKIRAELAALKSSQQEDGAYTRGFNAGRRDMAAAHVAEQAKAVDHAERCIAKFVLNPVANKLAEYLIKLAAAEQAQAKAQEAHQKELEDLKVRLKAVNEYADAMQLSSNENADLLEMANAQAVDLAKEIAQLRFSIGALNGALAVTERTSLASQAKLIRKCAEVKLIDDPRASHIQDYPDLTTSDLMRDLILSNLTPAMLQAEEAALTAEKAIAGEQGSAPAIP